MNYQDMTDDEINRLISKKYGVEFARPGCFSNLHSYPDYFYDIFGSIDYCNSWEDAGWIIKKYKISLTPFGDEWIAGENYNVRDKNPVRAVMIVFLMIKAARGE